MTKETAPAADKPKRLYLAIKNGKGKEGEVATDIRPTTPVRPDAVVLDDMLTVEAAMERLTGFRCHVSREM